MRRRKSAAAAVAPKTYSMPSEYCPSGSCQPRSKWRMAGVKKMPVESMRGFGQRLEAGADREKLAADGSGAGIGLARVDQVADKAGFSRTSGFSVSTHGAELARMARFCASAKPRLRSQRIPGCDLNCFRICTGTIGRGVVDHNDFECDPLLLENAIQAAPDIPLAVEGDNRHTNFRIGTSYESVIQRPGEPAFNYTEIRRVPPFLSKKFFAGCS